MKREIASELLRIKAVFLRPDEPFTWASGIKSPIYCDNRLVLSDTKARETVENGISELVKQHFPDADILMGTATAGIPHAAIAAYKLNLPMGYVRAGEKSHGRNNRIEGKLNENDRVVVIEDLISTAGSCVEVVDALREAGARVEGVISIFTYDLNKGKERLEKAGVKYFSLSDIHTLLDVAVEQKYITPSQKEEIQEFFKTLNSK